MSELNLTQEDIEPFKLQRKKTYTTLNTESEENLQHNKLKSKELEDDLYEKLSSKFRKEREKLDAMVKMIPFTSSNLEIYINLLLEFLVELPSLWTSSDYKGKQELEQTIFPKGLDFSKKKAKLELHWLQ